ncbi:hypothetical protein BC939DRAFT_48777 [Gamsiella multidivaricata]|uniref:uncharacterized protein n=1 Tax=Gamsiella multidivaricata TaxID=101098 RepID=UPI002220C4C6|nr:uncharacterized protein BC939DRAFT_48777 [Gamsiella multidivaricata]KAI7828723.1 hypothetical protein BC939DRAFT_48777 [Gamsiella multidivaricata]
MPPTEFIMQSISAPIPVPGTQQLPTMPAIPPDGDVAAIPYAGGNTNLAATGLLHISLTDQKPSWSISSGDISRPNSSASNHHLHNQPRHNNNYNSNSGLRKFPSIGSNKKLTIENTMLKAKVIELERYVKGLKEELILARRQIHAQRAEFKAAEEHKTEEIEELNDHIQKCEYELGLKILECEDLLQSLGGGHRAMGQGTNNTNAEGGYGRVEVLLNENARKDAQIHALLEKVDCLGTAILKLEREKAYLERPPTPPVDTAPTAPAHKSASSSADAASSSTLKDLVPITAAVIIAATTPNSPTHNPTSHLRDLSDSDSDNSIATSDSTAPSAVQSDQGAVNSVGYNLAVEHPKLLSKFQALRIQHAQVSEYLDTLESENWELRVQLLGVNNGFGTTAL